MSQPVAQDAKLADRHVESVRPVGEQGAVESHGSFGGEHAGYFGKREAGGAAEGNQGETLNHIRSEDSLQTPSSDRRDQPFLLVVSQCRGRDAGASRNLGYIQSQHPLDLKST